MIDDIFSTKRQDIQGFQSKRLLAKASYEFPLWSKPMVVVAPAGVAKWFTEGKEYKIRKNSCHWQGNRFGWLFDVKDDEGVIVSCSELLSHHSDSKKTVNWIIKERE